MPAFLRRRGTETLIAAIAFVAITVLMTWPIARGLAHDVPADLGDSLLNMWIMAWDAEAFVAMAAGTMSFAQFWNGNIFHPAPLTVTFSEHLIPQALQGLPFYMATGNIVLAYNVVFLATFALSGLGMFLFVRELTGSARVGFVAGLFFAFVPYRWGQFPHIQTISSQWMPFALYGLRRYFDRGSLAALAGGVLAFVAQGLSTGYYLFYFAPVFGGYALWEMAVRGRLRDLRTWITMAVAGAAAVALMLPFLLPYQQAKATQGFTRPYEEVLSFSADLYAYVNAPPQVRAWGPILNKYPQPEGDLFPGAVPILLAIVAIASWLVRARVVSRGAAMGTSAKTERAAWWLLALTALLVLAAVVIAITGGAMIDLGVFTLRATNVRRALTIAGALFAVGWYLSPRWRIAARQTPADLTLFFVLGIAFAVVMSLGPAPRAAGVRLSGLEMYSFFFDYVPGFEGLRTPARFAMVAAALLAPLAGLALAPIARWRMGTAVLALVGVTFLAETYAAPMAENVNWDTGPRYAMPWGAVTTLNEGPLAYRHLLAMPADTVVMELPFGDQAWDLRYVYYAGLHGKRILNGYSGYFPEGYRSRAARLSNLWSDRDAAWQAIVTSGATHLLLHVNAFHPPEGRAVANWLENQGARATVGFDDGDLLYVLPRH
ncbi:MAG: hypothetical protein U0P30_10945 [Vicinamibacterales bacterium]